MVLLDSDRTWPEAFDIARMLHERFGWPNFYPRDSFDNGLRGLSALKLLNALFTAGEPNVYSLTTYGRFVAQSNRAASSLWLSAKPSGYSGDLRSLQNKVSNSLERLGILIGEQLHLTEGSHEPVDAVSQFRSAFLSNHEIAETYFKVRVSFSFLVFTTKQTIQEKYEESGAKLLLLAIAAALSEAFGVDFAWLI